MVYLCTMRAVIQRVTKASVNINGAVHSSIRQGLLVLLGVGYDDSEEDIEYLVKKITNLRIFNDQEGIMNRSVMDINGDILVVSQFTLMASTKKGNRPSYIHAAPHHIAIPLYHRFCEAISMAIGKRVSTGEFGADMQVELTNDGPVTICMDSNLHTAPSQGGGARNEFSS